MLKYNKKKLDRIFKKHKVLFAYLFGSQAKGKSGPMSDIDIAVFFDDTLDAGQRFDKKLQLMAALSDLFEKEEVEVLPLNDAYPLIAHRVLKHGKLIYCQDIKKEKEYADKAIGEYLDWQPSLQEQVGLLFRWIYDLCR